MTHDSFPHDFAREAAKSLQPVTVAATQLTGAVDWQTWVLILTAVYVAMQIVWLMWKFADKVTGKKPDE